MTEKKFNQTYLVKVKKALKFALENEHSDFYRKKYAGLDINPDKINTYEDFCRIPPLTKDEILATPLEERLFVSKDEIAAYSLSSGTSGNNIPLITPRIKEPEHKYSENNMLIKHGIKKALMLLPVQRATKKGADLTIPYIALDSTKLSLAAKVTTAYQPEAIITTPTLLNLFIKNLKEENFDCSLIKYIATTTEYCTAQKQKLFQKVFPIAYIRFNYASSEIGGIVGYRCDDLASQVPTLYHPNTNNLLEIPEDVEGEIVCTNLTTKAFPLIRYRTGDVAKSTDHKCSCGVDETFTLQGRNTFDVFKTSGAIFHTQMIANAIDEVDHLIEPDFQLHIYEKVVAEQIITELILDVIPKNGSLEISSDKIAKVIERNLYLSADKTLEYFVEKDIFLPLKLRLVENLNSEAKSKHIIPHFE